MKTLEQAREERFDQEIDKMISDRLASAKLAAPIGPHARVKLRGILKKYAKSPHPFRACVKDTTEVETANGPVQIKDLQPGDLVWSHDGSEFELQPVLWSEITREDAQLMELTLDGGEKIVATPDHEFLHSNGVWMTLRNLKSGDALRCSLALSTISRARLAVALAGANALGDDSGVVDPEMPVRTRQGTAYFQLGDCTLLVLMGSESDVDSVLTATGHERPKEAHDWGSGSAVQSPMPNASGAAVYVVQDAAEEQSDPIERPAVFLSRGDEKGWRSYTAAGALAAVEAEGALALQESSGPRDVGLRRVESVIALDERESVWDIEVAHNHNFIVSGVVLHNCVKDNMSRFGPGRTEAICATLKDTIKGNKNWRKGGGSAMTSEDDAVIDGDVLLALDAISELDLQEIFLEIRAMEEHQTVEAVPLLGLSGKAELERWGQGVDMVEEEST